MTLHIGHGRAELDVPPGTVLDGYADRAAPATGTLDGLEVHCVAVGAAGRWLLLVVADVICAHVDLAADVAAALGATDAVDVWTLATHTHAGPFLDCGAGARVSPPEHRVAIAAAAGRAARRALDTAAAAEIRLSTVDVTGVGAARDRADGAPVVPVDLLDVRDRAGRRRGVLAVLPVHPTVLSADNLLVSGDLAAAVRRGLADRLGGWAVVATGCAGNVSTRATRREQTPAEVARLGGLAADQLATEPGRPPRLVAATGPVGTDRRTLTFPLRTADPVGHAVAGDGAFAARFAHTLRQGERIAAERARLHPDGTARLTVSAARIGPLRLAGLGAEPYLAIRDMLPAPTVVLGYTNGHAGYLPDAGAGLSYETLASPFPAGSAETAATAAAELLDRLSSRDDG